MAIKVSGTTVIDDNRNLTNIAGGVKTVGGSSVLGSGDIGFKTVGGTAVTGSGDIGFKTVGGSSVTGSGDIGFKTVNGSSIVGSGNVTVSAAVTGYGVVGSYIEGRPLNTTSYTFGDTASSVVAVRRNYLTDTPRWSSQSNAWDNVTASALQSGTWRTVTGAHYSGGWSVAGLWVRVT